MTTKTNEIYRPRIQAKALEFASAQAERYVDSTHRYMAWLLFQKMSDLERSVIGVVSAKYHDWYGFRKKEWTFGDMISSGNRAILFSHLEQIITKGYQDVAHLAEHWLPMAYVIGYVGFLYQLDCLTPPNVKPKANLTKDHIHNRMSQSWDVERGGGASWRHRLEVQANQLNRELQRTLEQSMLQKEHLVDAVGRIKKVFGSETTRRVSESLREADDLDFPSITSVGMAEDVSPLEGFVDDDSWNQAVEDLRTVMGWESRKPGYQTPETGGAYEVERNIMTEYSRMVRQGQVDARMPNDEVVSDFVWVAVSDKNECEDCEARQDMTMTEIADKLGDDSAPPLHYNCRCALIPSLPDFQPLAGDWQSDDVGSDSRLITDPDTGETEYPQVETMDEWVKRL